jgi:hypothetical protein
MTDQPFPSAPQNQPHGDEVHDHSRKIDQGDYGQVLNDEARGIRTEGGDYFEQQIVINFPSDTDSRLYQQAISALRAVKSSAKNHPSDIRALLDVLQANSNPHPPKFSNSHLSLITADLNDLRAQCLQFTTIEMDDFWRSQEEHRLFLFHAPDELLLSQFTNNILIKAHSKTTAVKYVHFSGNLSQITKELPKEETDCWLVLNNITTTQLKSINDKTFRQLQAELSQRGCTLLIITDSAVNALSNIPKTSVIHVKTLPADRETLVAHWIKIDRTIQPETREKLLAALSNYSNHPHWKSLLQQQTEMRGFYSLSQQLLTYWRQATHPANIDEIFSRIIALAWQSEIHRWFEQHTEWAKRAYMVTLAVMDGAHPSLIKAVYQRLLVAWGLPEQDEPQKAEYFAAIKENTATINKHTDKVYTIGFGFAGAYGLVLSEAWQILYQDHYESKYVPLFAWFQELAKHENESIRELVARSIATICYDRGYNEIKRMFIDPIVEEGCEDYNMMRLAQIARHEQVNQTTRSLLQIITGNGTVAEKDNALDQLTRTTVVESVLIEELTRVSADRALQKQDFLSVIVGTIFVYCIESGDVQLEAAVRDQINEWAYVLQEPSAQHVTPKQHFTKQFKNITKREYQHMLVLSYYSFAGGYDVPSAINTLTRLSSQFSSEMSVLMTYLGSAFCGTLERRMRRGGKEIRRNEIGLLVDLLIHWFNGNKQEKKLSASIFMYFSTLQVQPEVMPNPEKAEKYRGWISWVYLSDLDNNLFDQISRYNAAVFSDQTLYSSEKKIPLRQQAFENLVEWVILCLKVEDKESKVIPIRHQEVYLDAIADLCVGMMTTRQVRNNRLYPALRQKLERISKDSNSFHSNYGEPGHALFNTLLRKIDMRLQGY